MNIIDKKAQYFSIFFFQNKLLLLNNILPICVYDYKCTNFEISNRKIP